MNSGSSSSDETGPSDIDSVPAEPSTPFTTPATEAQVVADRGTASLWMAGRGGRDGENPECKRQRSDVEEVPECPTTLTVLQQRVLDRLVYQIDSRNTSVVVTNPHARGAPSGPALQRARAPAGRHRPLLPLATGMLLPARAPPSCPHHLLLASSSRGAVCEALPLRASGHLGRARRRASSRRSHRSLHVLRASCAFLSAAAPLLQSPAPWPYRAAARQGSLCASSLAQWRLVFVSPRARCRSRFPRRPPARSTHSCSPSVPPLVVPQTTRSST